jgi:hypothetical protein
MKRPSISSSGRPSSSSVSSSYWLGSTSFSFLEMENTVRSRAPVLGVPRLLRGLRHIAASGRCIPGPPRPRLRPTAGPCSAGVLMSSRLRVVRLGWVFFPTGRPSGCGRRRSPASASCSALSAMAQIRSPYVSPLFQNLPWAWSCWVWPPSRRRANGSSSDVAHGIMTGLFFPWWGWSTRGALPGHLP